MVQQFFGGTIGMIERHEGETPPADEDHYGSIRRFAQVMGRLRDECCSGSS